MLAHRYFEIGQVNYRNMIFLVIYQPPNSILNTEPLHRRRFYDLIRLKLYVMKLASFSVKLYRFSVHLHPMLLFLHITVFLIHRCLTLSSCRALDLVNRPGSQPCKDHITVSQPDHAWTPNFVYMITIHRSHFSADPQAQQGPQTRARDISIGT